nr:uncharacterized protein LOC128702062 [Cherax quadricarinatus]
MYQTDCVGTQEADISIGPISLTATRAEAADFAWPMWYDGSGILAGLGTPEIDTWGFLLPLTPVVWVALLVALLAASLVKTRPSSNISLKTFPLDTWLSNTFEFIRVLLQQGWVASYRWTERFLLVVWMMVTLVLTRSYSGNLMALLAVRHISQPYQSLQDVLDDPSAIMMWQRNSINAEYLQVVKSGLLYKVANLESKSRLLYVSQGEYNTLLDSVVRRGHHVLFDVGVTLRNLMAQHYSRTGKCDFYTSRETYLAFSASVISQKDNPILPALKYSYVSMGVQDTISEYATYVTPISEYATHVIPISEYATCVCQ